MRTAAALAVAVLLTALSSLATGNATAGSAGADDGPAMGRVPGGDFWMGRVRLWLTDEIGWQLRERQDDRPVHLVDLDPFDIDSLEVTNARYAEFVRATGATPPYQWRGSAPAGDLGQLPVYNVTWNEAVAYCGWRGKRLPTEAEWEKAARGGLDRQDYPWGLDYTTPLPEPRTTTDSSGGDGSAAAGGAAAATAAAGGRPGRAPAGIRHAWSGSATGPVKVGSYEPNAYGLYDMSGNVWEWTNDWYDLYAYGVHDRRNPRGPDTGGYKVIRGGSWADDEIRLGSVYFRNFANPGLRAPTIGFRCAKSAAPAAR
jgi:formylglycine-generating enzyme required for sulfatase activity